MSKNVSLNDLKRQFHNKEKSDHLIHLAQLICTGFAQYLNDVDAGIAVGEEGPQIVKDTLAEFNSTVSEILK